MKMKKFGFAFLMVALSFLFLQEVSAQFYFRDNNFYDSPLLFEMGGSVGIMNCLTDVGGKKGIGKPLIKDLNIGNTQLNGSVFVSALYKYAVGVRLEGSIGQIKAYDSILNPVKESTLGRYERNLQFRSSITELALTFEFHPLFIFINWLIQEKSPPAFSPYLTAGIGYFKFNPQAKLYSNWVDLPPLHTEGQGFAEYPDRKVYQLSQINFPLGAGIKYELTPNINLRAELVARILQTDYIDDVSTRYIDPQVFSKYFSGDQLNKALVLNDRRSKLNPAFPVNPKGGQRRGSPQNNDSYFTFNLKVGIAFGREKIGRPGSNGY
jgi:hypothetical protein